MLTKILPEDLNDKGVVGLADVPGLSTQEMQEKFDEIALDVIVPKFNALSDELSENGNPVGSESIKGIRLDSTGQLEVSFDGKQWQKVTSAPTADAEKLGGQPPSYYATAAGLADVEGQAQQAGEDAATAQQTAAAAMPKAGGSFTGTAYAQSVNTDATCLRNILVRPASGGESVSTNFIILKRL